jgi:serine/threonine-protein kinase HipA
MIQATLQLCLWLEKRLVAEITYSPAEEQWSLRYADAWRSDPAAFPLSPALPLGPPSPAHAVRRFLENLLPEGRALDVVAAAQGIAKSNIFALIRAFGSETTGAFRFLPPGVDGAADQSMVGWQDAHVSGWLPGQTAGLCRRSAGGWRTDVLAGLSLGVYAHPEAAAK